VLRDSAAATNRSGACAERVRRASQGFFVFFGAHNQAATALGASEPGASRSEARFP
jgi:hypothetical protein